MFCCPRIGALESVERNQRVTVNCESIGSVANQVDDPSKRSDRLKGDPGDQSQSASYRMSRISTTVPPPASTVASTRVTSGMNPETRKNSQNELPGW